MKSLGSSWQVLPNVTLFSDVLHVSNWKCFVNAAVMYVSVLRANHSQLRIGLY